MYWVQWAVNWIQLTEVPFFMYFCPSKKSDFSYFSFRFCLFLRIFDSLFWTICLILGFSSPPWNPRFPTGSPLSFYIKNRQKIGKKSDFRCRTPKTNFRFSMYTPKNIYLGKKYPFFMYFCLSNTENSFKNWCKPSISYLMSFPCQKIIKNLDT